METPGVRHMALGLLWFIGGVGFTLLTYAAAKPGGFYLVASGAIFFGILQFLYGFAIYVFSKISKARSSVWYGEGGAQKAPTVNTASKTTIQAPDPAEKISSSHPYPRISRWNALIQYDSDVGAAAERLRPYGERWVHELGRAFFALNEDKEYLDNIVTRLQVQAADERAQQWVDRFRITCSGELCTEASLEILSGEPNVTVTF